MSDSRERPILFSAPMVRALLAGTKTQTRLVVKGVDQWHPDSRTVKLIGLGDDGCAAMPYDEFDRMLGGAIKGPYGKPGDRLWVRETWAPDEYEGQREFYRADDEHFMPPCGWKPSIHMPRMASRITLEVTGVRVERLQDISAGDAWAEGISFSPDVDPVHEYQDLWEQINGPGSWSTNPWVWVVEFRRLP